MITPTPIQTLEGKKKYLEDYLSRAKRNCGVILTKDGERELQELIDSYTASIKVLEIKFPSMANISQQQNSTK